MRNIRLALFALFSYLLLVQLVVGVVGLKQGAKGSADFRHLYTAGYMVRTGQGHELYNYALEEKLQNEIVGPERTIPFDHLAYEALFYVPFSWLGFRAAYFAFAAVNFLCLIVAERLFRPNLASLESLERFVPEAMFFCFPPVVLAIILGQDSILLLLLAVLSFRALEMGQEARAGALWSLGFFKFQLVLPVILLFLLWRKWRFVVAASLCGAAAIGLSAWVAGISGTRAFLATMMEMSVHLSTDVLRYKFGTNPDAMPNLRGLIDALAAPHFAAIVVQAAVAAATILVIILAWRMQPSLPLAILAAVLVSYHGLIHDASLLILPLGLLLVRSVREENPLLGILTLAAFALPSFLYEFGHGRYSPMALLILTLFLLWPGAAVSAAGEPVPRAPAR